MLREVRPGAECSPVPPLTPSHAQCQQPSPRLASELGHRIMAELGEDAGSLPGPPHGRFAGVSGTLHISVADDHPSAAEPLCSVIVPLHNKVRYIGSALRSVCTQTHRRLEVIVVDDGSTDGSADAARSFQDPRIRIESQTNQGVSRARNNGLELASGEYIFFLDADDLWHPEHVAWTLRVFAACPTAALVAADFYLCDETIADAHEFKPLRAVDVDLVDDLALMWMNAGRQRFCTPTTAVRGPVLARLKPCFPEGTSLAEDVHLWFRVNSQAPLALIRQRLNVVRRGTPNSLTRLNEANWAVPPWVVLFEDAIARGTLRSSLAGSWPKFVMRHHTTKALEIAAAGNRRLALSRLLSARKYATSLRWWGSLILVLIPRSLQRIARDLWAHRFGRGRPPADVKPER